MKRCEFCTDFSLCLEQDECEAEDPSTTLDEEYWENTLLDGLEDD